MMSLLRNFDEQMNLVQSPPSPFRTINPLKLVTASCGTLMSASTFENSSVLYLEKIINQKLREAAIDAGEPDDGDVQYRDERCADALQRILSQYRPDNPKPTEMEIRHLFKGMGLQILSRTISPLGGVEGGTAATMMDPDTRSLVNETVQMEREVKRLELERQALEESVGRISHADEVHTVESQIEECVKSALRAETVYAERFAQVNAILRRVQEIENLNELMFLEVKRRDFEGSLGAKAPS